MVANLKVCSTGIDLDDKDGNFPRVCFLSPNFMALDIQQLFYRFRRLDTQSNAYVYLVYGRGQKEVNVQKALYQKGIVMLGAACEHLAAGVMFPCRLQSYDEKESFMSPV